jgi:hypothetical protein
MLRTGLDWRELGGEWYLWVLDEEWIDFLRAGGLAGTWERSGVDFVDQMHRHLLTLR